jgi:hypothetical protein
LIGRKSRKLWLLQYLLYCLLWCLLQYLICYSTILWRCNHQKLRQCASQLLSCLSILLVAWNQICTFWFITGNDENVQNLFWIKSNISKINFRLDEIYSSKKIIISFPYERTAVSTTVFILFFWFLLLNPTKGSFS